MLKNILQCKHKIKSKVYEVSQIGYLWVVNWK